MILNNTIEEQYTKFRLNNYGSPTITIVKGKVEYVWDDKGKEYLDFSTGIATT